MSEIHTFEIEEAQAGQRLDKALADLCDDLSRARLQGLIEQQQVAIDGDICVQAARKLKAGQVVSVTVPPAVEAEPAAEDIPLDIVFEDDDLLVLNKAAGMVVHPGAGNHEGTLVNALLHHCGDSLSGIGGVLRPGIVHRLDKDTSGLMLVAKNDKAHQSLSGQLQDRSVSRAYKALVLGVPMPPMGTVDQPIGRHPSNRLKMAVNQRHGKNAVTHYSVLERYEDALALLECRLESGRTHQIRVHMGWQKYPIVGDPLYGPQKTALQAALGRADCAEGVKEAVLEFPRQALHAYKISFEHPKSGKEMIFEAPLPADFEKILELLQN